VLGLLFYREDGEMLVCIDHTAQPDPHHHTEQRRLVSFMKLTSCSYYCVGVVTASGSIALSFMDVVKILITIFF
jgi:hypothetical protein